ncbi:MAG: grdB [Clostridia bacterium]|jgi:glycine reductase|nr:grdB [Clostridia bacterium]
MDRVGLPNAHITAFTSIAVNVGANRIVFGGDFTTPAGNPELPLEREKAYRRKILLKALDAITQGVPSPTIFAVDESREG